MVGQKTNTYTHYISPLVERERFASLAAHMLRNAIAWVVLLSCWAVNGAELVFDFRDDKAGEPPRNFRSVLAGYGHPGEWKIVMDDIPSILAPLSPNAPSVGKRPVLAQLSRERTDEH